ncbi:MAG: DNA-binding protein [Clostridia bacterium]|nr:DNA-binding protein [Clostridia bacterium]
MNGNYITIVGQRHYFGMKPFKVGGTVKLVKEPDNDCDSEAIRVEMPYIDTIGYVANSSHTVFDGTNSAGRIYDKIGDFAYARVCFITHSSVIADIISPEETALPSSYDEILF